MYCGQNVGLIINIMRTEDRQSNSDLKSYILQM